MKVKHKGFLLVADKSFDQLGRVAGAIFKLPTFESVEEKMFDSSPTDAIKQLKMRVKQLVTPQKV